MHPLSCQKGETGSGPASPPTGGPADTRARLSRTSASESPRLSGYEKTGFARCNCHLLERQQLRLARPEATPSTLHGGRVTQLTMHF